MPDDVLLLTEWTDLLERIRQTGSANEKIMSSMLKDILNGACPSDVFNAWTSTFLDKT